MYFCTFARATIETPVFAQSTVRIIDVQIINVLLYKHPPSK